MNPHTTKEATIDREEYPWYAALVEAWGKERTQKYMTALARQDIQWREGFLKASSGRRKRLDHQLRRVRIVNGRVERLGFRDLGGF
jgi:hypothetical protein